METEEERSQQSREFEAEKNEKDATHETVSGPLREEGDPQNHSHSLPVSWSLNERYPRDRGVPLQLQRRLNFVHLELDDGIVLVVVLRVVASEDLLGLSDLSLGNQPPRRLGNEPVKKRKGG